MTRPDHPLHAVLDIRDKEEAAAAAAKADKQRKEQDAREQASARWQLAKPVMLEAIEEINAVLAARGRTVRYEHSAKRTSTTYIDEGQIRLGVPGKAPSATIELSVSPKGYISLSSFQFEDLSRSFTFDEATNARWAEALTTVYQRQTARN